VSDDRFLSTAEAARLLGVSASTVKRWVDEGCLLAQKTAGGHRKIRHSDVQRLLRRCCAAAVPGAAGRCEAVDPAGLADALFAALLQGEADAVCQIFQRAHQGGLRLGELADAVIAPAMCRLGHGWKTGQLDVYQEHRGTQLCLAALHGLRARLNVPPDAGQPPAIGGCPEHDPYLLATLLAEMVLRECGWRTVNLGPNTPLASFRRALCELRPRLLWLSCSHLPEPEAFLAGYRDLYREAEAAGVAVAVGGRALTEPLRRQMPYTTFGDGLAHLAAFARTLYPTVQAR
jgi:excisionase family DNA binding protein